MKFISQSLLFIIAIVVFISLQWQLWVGDSGRFEHKKLLTEIETEQHLIDTQRENNRILAADVQDLKNGLEAIEEHARLDLGLIKPNETFVQMSTSATKTDQSSHTQFKKSSKTHSSVESIPQPLEESE